MKQELGKYMSWIAELFLRENLDLLDNNMAEFYNKANWHLSNKDFIGQITSFLYKQGINPLLQMSRVPMHYLGAAYSRYIDEIPNLIPSNVISVGDEAFNNLWWSKIRIPSNIQKIGIAAFKDSYLQSVILEEGLNEIGNAAFMYCDSLEEVIIPDSVKKLGYNCFSFTGLKKLYIGSNVEDLCNNQFDLAIDVIRFI